MRFLIVSARLLYPADTGGKIRSSRLFEALSRQHDLTIVAFQTPEDTPDRIEQMRRCCRRLVTVPWRESEKFTARFYWDVISNLFSPRSFAVAKYRDPRMERTVRGLVSEEQFDVLVCDFLQPSINVLDIPFVPKILFQHNVEAVIRRRHFEQVANPAIKAYLYWEWKRLRAYERRAARAFDHCLMVSEDDRRTMYDEYGVTTTSVVPTGADVHPEGPGDDAEDGVHLIFTGSMDWFANEDAVFFFVRDILPRLRREIAVTFWIVGRNPSPRVRHLAAIDAGVMVTGTVPDVRPYIARATVYVAPLRIAGGTRIKIFEAMGMGRAVVSTRIGAEGLPVVDGEHVLLADEAGDFAEKVIALVRDRTRRQLLARAGWELVRRNYSWEKAAEQFAAVCQQVRDHVSGRGRL